MGTEYSFPKKVRASLESYTEANQSLLAEFEIQEDVEMYRKLHEYDYFHGLNLPNEMELSAISKRISTVFPNQSRITLKHHLFNAHVPKKLFKARR